MLCQWIKHVMWDHDGDYGYYVHLKPVRDPSMLEYLQPVRKPSMLGTLITS